MIYVFTGDGKGKTTAALGAAMRAVGEGKKVLMVQFIKGPWKSGEDEAYKKLAPDFLLVKMGRGFVGILGDALPREEHARAAREALAYARSEIISGKWNVVILDEIINAIALNLLPEKEVEDVVSEAAPNLDLLILTGRGAPQSLMERADLVTEMRDVKHPYRAGIKARRGIEY